MARRAAQCARRNRVALETEGHIALALQYRSRLVTDDRC